LLLISTDYPPAFFLFPFDVSSLTFAFAGFFFLSPLVSFHSQSSVGSPTSASPSAFPTDPAPSGLMYLHSSSNFAAS